MKQEIIKSGATKFTTLGGYKGWIEITQSKEAIRITKKVIIPKDKYKQQETWLILRETDKYVYIQEQMYIQMEMFKALNAFIFFDK